MQLRVYNVNSLEDRVNILRELVWAPQGGLRDPLLRQIGLLITRGCPPRNDMCELKAIFDFVTFTWTEGGQHQRKFNVRYTGDVATKDTFQSALRTLQLHGGDCDDMSILDAVLAMENGYKCQWRITSNTGATWDHIYCMAAIPKHKPNRWIALDTTLGPGRFTHEPPRVKYRDFLVAKDEG